MKNKNNVIHMLVYCRLMYVQVKSPLGSHKPLLHLSQSLLLFHSRNLCRYRIALEK